MMCKFCGVRIGIKTKIGEQYIPICNDCFNKLYEKYGYLIGMVNYLDEAVEETIHYLTMKGETNTKVVEVTKEFISKFTEVILENNNWRRR